jgi:hypothetical protein
MPMVCPEQIHPPRQGMQRLLQINAERDRILRGDPSLQTRFRVLGVSEAEARAAVLTPLDVSPYTDPQR